MEFGLHVPIPTLPFMMATPPASAVVPIPIFPEDVIKKRSPTLVGELEIIMGDLLEVFTISKVVAGVVVPIPTLSVVVVL